MTTQTSSSEKSTAVRTRSHNHRFFNSAYFSFNLMTGWPLFVTFVLIFVLALIVPGVRISSEISRDIGFVSRTEFYDDIRTCVSLLGLIGVGASMVCGFIGGLTTMRYIDNKVAVNFYHSLPLRREAHFVTSVLPPFVTYLVSFIAASAVNVTTYILRFGYVAGTSSIVAHSLLYGVIFFMLIYSITLVGASLSGTGFMRFVSTLYIMFMPLAIYALFVAIIASGSSMFNSEYYFGDNIISICLPMRFLYAVSFDEAAVGNGANLGYIAPFSSEIAVTAVISVVMLFVSFVLYMWRHSESASRPLVWGVARFIFKYSSMFMGATLFGLIFRVMFESDGWMIFGIVVGSLIMFMLVNGILNKSARAMFMGLRGFAVYGAAMAAVVIVFYADAFGIYSTTPSASFVKTATVSLGNYYNVEFGGDLAYRTTKLCAMMLDADENKDSGSEKATTQYYDSFEKDNYFYEFPEEIIETIPIDTDTDLSDRYPGVYSGEGREYIWVNVVYKTKLGFDIAMEYHIDCATVDSFAKYVERYANEHGGGFPDSDDELNYVHISSSVLPLGKSYISGENPECAELLEYFKNRGDTTDLGCAIGAVTFGAYHRNGYFGGKSATYTYMFYEKETELMKKLSVEDADLGENIIADYIGGIDHIIVVSNDSEKWEIFYDRDEIFTIVNSLYAISDYWDNVVPCTKDHTYNVFFVYTSEPDTDDGKYYNTSDVLSFAKGEVPQIVTEAFAD